MENNTNNKIRFVKNNQHLKHAKILINLEINNFFGWELVVYIQDFPCSISFQHMLWRQCGDLNKKTIYIGLLGRGGGTFILAPNP